MALLHVTLKFLVSDHTDGYCSGEECVLEESEKTVRLVLNRKIFNKLVSPVNTECRAVGLAQHEVRVEVVQADMEMMHSLNEKPADFEFYIVDKKPK